MDKTIIIAWGRGPISGALEVSNARLVSARLAQGNGTCEGATFNIKSAGPCRLEVALADARVAPGAPAAMVTVRTQAHAFTFFLRDVTSDHPIFLPAYNVAVTEGSDGRGHAELARAVRGRKLKTGLQHIEGEPEESFEPAAARARNQKCQTWLGLSRDMRLFRLDVNWGVGCWGWVLPAYHGVGVNLPENDNQPASYEFVVGRGAGYRVDVTRRLEQGVLPIVRSIARDGEMVYELTAFAGNERTPLRADALRGTHFLVADGNGLGHMFTPEQQREYDSLLPQEINRDEEVVFYLRAEAKNDTRVPRYAWFKVPLPVGAAGAKATLDAERGFGTFAADRVFCLSTLNGQPVAATEIAVLVPPKQSAVFECRLPHTPISQQRALALAKADFGQRFAECRAFWQAKLDRGAKLHLPEPRLDEMARAGLLHLDLVAYGREPEGTIAPTIGLYCPIGSESTPIIMFFDSMGWHDIARRALTYFLDKQHDDGFIQNFGGYTIETGAALHTLGEHYRYTHDDAWIKQIAPKLKLACDYLIAWRRRNQVDSLQGHGYGMLDGKVADPEDATHYFMNSGYAYAGLKRAAEMLAKTDPAKAKELSREAADFRHDIRASLAECMARSPVIPLGDGTWCPTAAPWAEARGALSLFAEGFHTWTHGAFVSRDSLIGPLWLVFTEVLDPDEPLAEALLFSHHQLATIDNAAFSQPYYSRHDYAHLRRGEVKPFLKLYYNTFAGLADRETYTFWEHFFGASPHKTHEEGWFLMQTRWMLWMEQGDTLKLLSGVPRAWLADGKRIELSNVASHFGHFSLTVESKTASGRITARLDGPRDRRPSTVVLRLPHPDAHHPRDITGGIYDRDHETITIAPFTGSAEVTLRFA